MFLKNVWYVAAWSFEVPTDGLFARQILGEKIVFWRKTDGQAVAMPDFCPHRWAPLSLGRREGDAIRCMYHGLLFDAAGTCIEEPSADRPSRTLRLRVYPTVEKDGYVWIWMGDPARAHDAAPPDHPEQTSGLWHYNPQHLVYQARYELLMDNLLDASHLGFVHENSIGGGRYHADERPVVETHDWGVRVTRTYQDVPVPPFVRNIARFSGLADRWQVFDWRIEGNQLVIQSGQAPAGSGALEGRYAPEAFRFHSVQTITPETETSSHYFFMFAHDFQDETQRIADEITRQFAVVLEEDRLMIEGQQAVLAAHPEARMGGIRSDVAVARARGMLEKRLREETKVARDEVAA